MNIEVICSLNGNTQEHDIQKLQAHNFKIDTLLRSVYKGREENSYRLSISNISDLRKFEELLKEHHQEAYLYFQDDTTHLVNLNTNDVTNVGKYTPVDKDTALTQENYTYDYLKNQFFICIK